MAFSARFITRRRLTFGASQVERTWKGVPSLAKSEHKPAEIPYNWAALVVSSRTAGRGGIWTAPWPRTKSANFVPKRSQNANVRQIVSNIE